MKVKEYVEGILGSGGEVLLKIGTEKGSGFFFVGTAKEYMDMRSRIDKAVKKKAEGDVYAKAMRLLWAISDKRLKREVEDYVLFEKKLPAKLKERLAFKKRAVKAYENALMIKASSKGISKREILEEYDSDPVMDKAKILIVEGYESGKYWDKTERSDSPLGLGYKRYSRRKPTRAEIQKLFEEADK